MAVRCNHSLLLTASLFAASLLGACASLGNERPQLAYGRDLNIRAELAAALAAATLRAELPFADPAPQWVGAPVTQLGPDSFVVRYEHRAGDSWLPNATHRIQLLRPHSTVVEPEPRVRIEPANGMPGFGGAADFAIELRIVAKGSGCVVQGTLPSLPNGDLAAALAQTWQLLEASPSTGSGLRDANLRTFVSHRRLAESSRCAQHGNLLGAEVALRQAIELGQQAPELELTLARYSQQNGNGDRAAAHFRNVARRAVDPTLRQQAAALASSARSTDAIGLGQQLRRQALVQLRQHDVASAAAMLHSAHRQDPDGARDYRLLEKLHEHAGDAWSAFACALLDREQTGEGRGDDDRLPMHMANVGMAGLASRLETARQADLATLPLSARPRPASANAGAFARPLR